MKTKKKLCSLYMRVNENLGECILQKTDVCFVLIECFVLKNVSNHALCLPFVEMTNLKMFNCSDPFPFFFQISNPGSPVRVLIDELAYKTAYVLPSSGCYIVSVIKEGYEHN